MPRHVEGGQLPLLGGHDEPQPRLHGRGQVPVLRLPEDPRRRVPARLQDGAVQFCILPRSLERCRRLQDIHDEKT